MPGGLVRVLPDTNVCYPISLLDLVLRCDEQDLHRVVWTDALLEELAGVWVRNGARSADSAHAITDQIRAVFATGRIAPAHYEHLIVDMPGHDPDDHQHAAAAVAVAPSFLLTANLADFPLVPLADRGVTVLHPDDYFVNLLQDEPVAVLGVIEDMAAHRTRPPLTAGDILQTLQRAGLPRFAAEANSMSGRSRRP